MGHAVMAVEWHEDARTCAAPPHKAVLGAAPARGCLGFVQGTDMGKGLKVSLFHLFSDFGILKLTTRDNVVCVFLWLVSIFTYLTKRHTMKLKNFMIMYI